MPPAPSSTKAYVAPFAAFVVLMIVADPLPAWSRIWLYPAQTVVCGALLIRFWSVYGLKFPKGLGFTLMVAILVLLLWISPQAFFGLPGRFVGFDPTVYKATRHLYPAVVAVRFIRLTVIVPFVEEIFWRGFLLRFLVREDFESVPPGTFTWLSFSVVTAGFCIEHQFADWPAALLTGALFNWVYYRTRSLASCILAHAVANFLLGIYIMRTGQWGFW